MLGAHPQQQRQSVESSLRQQLLHAPPAKLPATSNAYWTRRDGNAMQHLNQMKPWKHDGRYFSSVEISSLATLKILMHAQTGFGKQGVLGGSNNWVEVMGYLKGYYYDQTLVITDSFALPVEANEVECQLSEDAQIYLVGQMEYERNVGRGEPAIGWYHSHPGYSCYLSGTDVNTQKLQQASQDPWIALVVDPVRSLATGKVELKAFRTLPEASSQNFSSPYGGYNARTGNTKPTDLSSIPVEKIAQFGVYVNQYYELPITYFRSEADASLLATLWDQYWGATLSASNLITNRPFLAAQTDDVVTKLSAARTVKESSASQSSNNNSSGGSISRAGAVDAVTAAKHKALVDSLGSVEATEQSVAQNIHVLTRETAQDLLSDAVRGSLFGF
jgi:COP9 signalosome complex subunit 5